MISSWMIIFDIKLQMQKRGICLVSVKKAYWNRPEVVAFGASLAVGFFVHLFGLVNILHNHDDIWNQPMGFGAGITSGRWLLSILGRVSQKLGLGYNLPTVNGIIFLVLIAVSAGIVISVLQIRNRVSAGLMGAFWTVFPSVTSVMFYKFTTVYYGIAVCLSVLAVWVFQKQKYGLLISAVCIACSLGIYQGYVPITISLMVLVLLKQALDREINVRILISRGLLFSGSLVLGVLLYFLILKGLTAAFHISLTDYQGINSMGKMSLHSIPSLIHLAVRQFIMLPIHDYCSLANIGLLKVCYVAVMGLSVVIFGFALVKSGKQWLEIALDVSLFLLLPLAINFIVVMCPDGDIHTLMVYAFALMPGIPLVLLECWEKDGVKLKNVAKTCRWCVSIALAVMIFCYGYYANVHYTAMYYANRQVENYFSSMVTQIRMTPGYDTEKQWAFIGNISDPLLKSDWKQAMSYGGHCFTDDLLNQYSRISWINHYLGYQIPEVSGETLAELMKTESVREMPCWPNEGSIQIIGDVVVIKLENILDQK